VTAGGTGTRYYEEVPIDHVLDGGFGAADGFYTVTLEYGPDHDVLDPFDVEAGRAWEADPIREEDRYLHPVIRRYEAGKQVGQVVEVEALHLPEDVCNEWSGEATHRVPLRDMLARTLAPAPVDV
jgi:hypothetical protein